jgi:hypothetical protein
MGYNKVQPDNRTSPSFVTRVDEMDICNVLTIMLFTSLKFTIGHSGNALKTQCSEVLPASCAGQAVANEDYKKTRTSSALESGRTSMSMNFTGDLLSNELPKNSSDHYNPQQENVVQSTKTVSLRPKGEVPQKKPTTRCKPLGDFSIVPHFEVTGINENLK